MDKIIVRYIYESYGNHKVYYEPLEAVIDIIKQLQNMIEYKDVCQKIEIEVL